ncbi:MAG: hypothetical protein WBF17_12660, partial [Phycisphaerae bacterium]
KAVEFGLRAGRATRAVQAAAEALELLDAKAPEKRQQRQTQRLAVMRLRYRHSPRASKKTAALDLLDALQAGAETAEAARQWTAAKDLYREAYSVAYDLRSPLGELIAFRRLRASHFEAVARRVELEKRKLTAGQTGTVAREKLLEMLVIELRDLDEAQKLLTDEVSQTWRSYLPLARRDPEKLSESAAAELGRWYHQFLAPKASKFSQLRIMLAAKACYRRAMKLHDPDAAEWKAVAGRLAELEEQLIEFAMYPTAGGRGADVDLLRGINVNPAEHQGVWDLSKGVLTTWPRRDGCLRLPATVTGNYRLSLRFMNRNHIPLPDRFSQFDHLRVSKKGHIWLKRLLDPSPGVNVALPVGDRHVALSVLPEPVSGKTKGILAIVEPPIDYDEEEDEPAASRPAGGATRPAPAATQPAATMPNDAGPSPGETITAEVPYISRERFHQLDIAVFVELGVATVVINLNEKALIRWQGEVSRCVLDDIWPATVPRGAILLGGWRGPTAFNCAKICNFSGQARLDRPDKPQP